MSMPRLETGAGTTRLNQRFTTPIDRLNIPGFEFSEACHGILAGCLRGTDDSTSAFSFFFCAPYYHWYSMCAYVALMTVRVLFISLSMRPTITGIPCVCIRVHLFPPFQMDPNSSLQLNGSLCVSLSLCLLLSRFRALALSRAIYLFSRAFSLPPPIFLSPHTHVYINTNKHYQTKMPLLAQGTRCPTSFPEPIGQAASFNEGLWHSVAKAIGLEGRALVNGGVHGPNVFAPNINLWRDPRWGRGYVVIDDSSTPLFCYRVDTNRVRRSPWKIGRRTPSVSPRFGSKLLIYADVCTSR